MEETANIPEFTGMHQRSEKNVSSFLTVRGTGELLKVPVIITAACVLAMFLIILGIGGGWIWYLACAVTGIVIFLYAFIKERNFNESVKKRLEKLDRDEIRKLDGQIAQAPFLYHGFSLLDEYIFVPDTETPERYALIPYQELLGIQIENKHNGRHNRFVLRFVHTGGMADTMTYKAAVIDFQSLISEQQTLGDYLRTKCRPEFYLTTSGYRVL